MWVVWYRPGGLKDLELSATPETLAEAKRAAEDDLELRVALHEIPRFAQ